MDKDTRSGNDPGLWHKLTGSPSEFSVENRAFNYVCLITAIILVYYLIFEIYFSQIFIAYFTFLLLPLLAVLYYFSRYKKKYHAGVIIFAISGYIALIVNYYVNSGSIGATLCLFFLVFQLLVGIGKPRQYGFWITLNLLIPFGLLLSEYLHPEWVPNTYKSHEERFIDIYITYTSAVAFIFIITRYLRRQLNKEQKIAEENTQAIALQASRILQQNEILEKVNQEKNKLFSIISHDLRAPLDSVKSYLELLSTHTLTTEEKNEMESQLIEQTKYTSDLLGNLLSWAKTQMGGVNVTLVPIQVKWVVDSIANNQISLVARKGIKLTYSIHPSLELVADVDMLKIVLRNLINNAIKFTRPGGEITIKAEKSGNDIRISVADTGIGIPADKQGEIFSSKVHSTYGTNNEKGVGLGLMMCKEFMNYQNGKIAFTSTEGVGSTFYITLPATRR